MVVARMEGPELSPAEPFEGERQYGYGLALVGQTSLRQRVGHACVLDVDALRATCIIKGRCTIDIVTLAIVPTLRSTPLFYLNCC